MRSIRVFVLLFATAGCVSSGNPAGSPKQMFVHPAARELRILESSSGRVDVTYGVQENFPAPQLRESIARRLRESGYHLLDHDFLDPSAKVETPREWASYIDGRTRPETCVREIVEDWQNAKGDVVRSGLRYDSACDRGSVHRSESTTESLRVNAMAIPASAVREMLDALRKASPRR